MYQRWWNQEELLFCYSFWLLSDNFFGCLAVKLLTHQPPPTLATTSWGTQWSIKPQRCSCRPNNKLKRESAGKICMFSYPGSHAAKLCPFVSLKKLVLLNEAILKALQGTQAASSAISSIQLQLKEKSQQACILNVKLPLNHWHLYMPQYNFTSLIIAVGKLWINDSVFHLGGRYWVLCCNVIIIIMNHTETHCNQLCAKLFQ